MRAAILWAGLVMVACPGQAAAAKTAELDCITEGWTAEARHRVVTAMHAPAERRTADENAAFDDFRQRVQGCVAKFGWDEQHAMWAATYAGAKAMLVEAEDGLRKLGVSPGAVDRLIARIDPDTLAQLQAGVWPDKMESITNAFLKSDPEGTKFVAGANASDDGAGYLGQAIVTRVTIAYVEGKFR